MKNISFSFKVLVVDDEVNACDYIADMIALAIPDATVIKSNNPHTALSLIETDYFNMLFIDIEMPQMSGLALLEKLNFSEQKPYIALVSDHSEFKYAQSGMDLGASDYLLKPISPEKIQHVYRKYQMRYNEHILQGEITFIKGNIYYNIKTSDIIAVEKDGKYHINIWTINDYICHIKGNLSEVFEYLSGHFLYINRQCIVNYRATKQFYSHSNTIVLPHNGTDIYFTASRQGRKDFISRSNCVLG